MKRRQARRKQRETEKERNAEQSQISQPSRVVTRNHRIIRGARRTPPGLLDEAAELSHTSSAGIVVLKLSLRALSLPCVNYSMILIGEPKWGGFRLAHINGHRWQSVSRGGNQYKSWAVTYTPTI